MRLPFDPYLLLFNFWEQFATSSYFKLAVIVAGVFVMVILLAMVRKHIFRLSMKGAVFGFITGVIVMLLLDLMIIFGMTDKSKIDNLSQKENRQEAFQEIILSGMNNLGNVLGVATTTLPKETKPVTLEELVGEYLNLPKNDAEKFKGLLCPE